MAISEILLNSVKRRVAESILSKPYEAMSLATELIEEHPDSEEALALVAKTALQARVAGFHLITSDLYEKISRAREERFFSPELVSLGISAKVMMGGKIDRRDMADLKRAFVMGPRITREIMGMACKLMSEDDAKKIEDIMKQ